MTKKLTGKVAPTGFVVMETYSVQIDIPAELQAAFEKNPEKFIRQFLRENGQKVNSIQITKSDRVDFTAASKARRRAQWFHIVYPPEEKSDWICTCGPNEPCGGLNLAKKSNTRRT